MASTSHESIADLVRAQTDSRTTGWLRTRSRSLRTTCRYLRCSPKLWKSRFVVLSAAHLMSFKDDTESSMCSCAIRLEDCDYPSAIDIHATSFELRCGDEVFVFEAETGTESSEWVRRLQIHIQLAKNPGLSVTSHLVDNTQLQSPQPGVHYRLSPHLESKDRHSKVAEYGTVVHGVLWNSKWLRVGDRFLPLQLEGKLVLKQQERLKASPSGRKLVVQEVDGGADGDRYMAGKKAFDELRRARPSDQLCDNANLQNDVDFLCASTGIGGTTGTVSSCADDFDNLSCDTGSNNFRD